MKQIIRASNNFKKSLPKEIEYLVDTEKLIFCQ